VNDFDYVCFTVGPAARRLALTAVIAAAIHFGAPTPSVPSRQLPTPTPASSSGW
jgi:hypothetical protein